MSKFTGLKSVKNLFGDVADGMILGLCALALSFGTANVAMAITYYDPECNYSEARCDWKPTGACKTVGAICTSGSINQCTCATLTYWGQKPDGGWAFIPYCKCSF